MYVRVLIVMTLILSACASGGAGSEAQGESEPRWLTEALATTRSSGGWPLPEGSWLSDSFGATVVFNTPTDLLLVAENERIVYLALPNSNNLIMIAKTAGMWNGSADVPVPQETNAITEAWEANPANRIDRFGELDGSVAVPWWDIVVTEADDFVYPCWLGLSCAFNTFGGDNKVHSLQGERMRSYARNDLGLGIGVHVTGSPEGIDEAISIADIIAASLQAADTELPERPETRFIGATEERGIPEGPIVFPVADYALTLNLPSPMSSTEWISHLGGLELYQGDSFMAVVDPILVDPAKPPTFCPPSQFGPPTGRPAYLDTNSRITVNDFDSYLSTFVVIEDTGTAELFGQMSSWWQLGEPNDSFTVECKGANGNQRTASFLFSQEGGFPHVAGDEGTSRFYLLEDSGLMVVSWTAGDVDNPLRPFEQVINAAELSSPN